MDIRQFLRSQANFLKPYCLNFQKRDFQKRFLAQVLGRSLIGPIRVCFKVYLQSKEREAVRKSDIQLLRACSICGISPQNYCKSSMLQKSQFDLLFAVFLFCLAGSDSDMQNHNSTCINSKLFSISGFFSCRINS